MVIKRGREYLSERTLQLIGWLLFLFCAVLFLINSASFLELVASVSFLLGCIVFLIGYFIKWK